MYDRLLYSCNYILANGAYATGNVYRYKTATYPMFGKVVRNFVRHKTATYPMFWRVVRNVVRHKYALKKTFAYGSGSLFIM